MSYLKFDRKDKLESYKLIRQLVCYLFLENQHQLCIEHFLDPNLPSDSRKSAILKQYRTFFRYICEILYCLGDKYDFADTWYTFYSAGSFYRGYDTMIQIRKYWPSGDKQINPIKPSNVHECRLIRTMVLAQTMVERAIVEVKNDDQLDYPSLHFFQSVVWPKHRVQFGKDYSEANPNLSSRTVQRDMRAVYSAVAKYFEMGEVHVTE